MLYSNIPLKLSKKCYVPLTREIIRRKERMNYKSVVLLSECSLVACSQDYKDELLNEEVSLFVKLFRHETKGGKMYIETQAVSDLHYAFKRSINSVIYIHNSTRTIPFILKWQVKELTNVEDFATSNFNDDTESELLNVYGLKNRIFKAYDTHCYSVFTDYLNVNDLAFKLSELEKPKEIVSFKKFKSLKGDVKNDENL